MLPAGLHLWTPSKFRRGRRWRHGERELTQQHPELAERLMGLRPWVRCSPNRSTSRRACSPRAIGEVELAEQYMGIRAVE